MDDLILRVAGLSGLAPATVRSALAMVLAFLQQECPPHDVKLLFDALPGADELAAEVPGDGPPSYGIGGGLPGLAGRLATLGLQMPAMQVLGREFIAHCREAAGEETTGRMLAGIPGLSDFV